MLFYIFVAIWLFSAIFCRNKKMFKIVYTIDTAILLFLLVTTIDCFYDFYIKPDIGYLFVLPWIMILFILFSILRACMKISIWDRIVPFLSIVSIDIWSMDTISGGGIARVIGDILLGAVCTITMVFFYIKTIKTNNQKKNKSS